MHAVLESSRVVRASRSLAVRTCSTHTAHSSSQRHCSASVHTGALARSIREKRKAHSEVDHVREQVDLVGFTVVATFLECGGRSR